jgi:hypothetical protein
LIPSEDAGLNEHSVIESLESVFDPQVRTKIVCGYVAPGVPAADLTHLLQAGAPNRRVVNDLA